MNKEKFDKLKQLSQENFSHHSEDEKTEIKLAYRASLKGLLTSFAMDYTKQLSIEGSFQSDGDVYEFINNWVENHVTLAGY